MKNKMVLIATTFAYSKEDKRENPIFSKFYVIWERDADEFIQQISRGYDFARNKFIRVDVKLFLAEDLTNPVKEAVSDSRVMKGEEDE